MAIPKSYPLRFTPRGLADAFDSTDAFPGACRSLVNLILDQSNPELVVSRPGVKQIDDFSTFGDTVAGISIEGTIGTRVFGMVASTGAAAGFDVPFCFDLLTSTFVTITGADDTNTPATQPTTGPWVPPTMAQVGVFVIITHPGFDGTGTNIFGVIDLTNPAAPVWYSSDLDTNPLGAVPSAVANFNNRAYFAVGNSLPYADALLLKRTNSSQQLTIGDSGVITALSGLPLTTTSSGILQALIIFKESQIWQVTGDTTLSNLAQNYMTLTIGTSMPRSIAQSPQAIYFGSNSGPYFIDPFGVVRPLTHGQQNPDPDIQKPFINATEPSRVAGAYASSIYRICIDTIIDGVQSVNDYWFSEKRRRWSGPHSFPYDCATSYGNYFVLASKDHPSLIIKGPVVPDLTTEYLDLGVPTSGGLLSATFPKTGRMTEKQVVESTQELSAGGVNADYIVTAYDEQGVILGSVMVSVIPEGTRWGANRWLDGSRWRNASNIPHVYSLPWAAPIVFKKMAIGISIGNSQNIKIGTHYARYQDTGYMNLTKANTP